MATGIDVVEKQPGRAGGAGRPPYGYRVVAGLASARTVEPDPVTAPVVRRIFEQYAAGRGLQVIAEALTADGVLCPSAYDRARNAHRSGVAWSKGAVRAVLVNPRYVGAEREPAPVEPLIEPDLVARVRDSADRKRAHPASADARVYRLRGILRCHYCGRAMQGTWNNGEPYYRCRFPRRYADANGIAHPRSVYVRERRLLGPLHQWLSSQGEVGRLETLREDRDPAGVYRCLRLRLTFRSVDSPVLARFLGSGNTVIRGAVAL